MITERKLLKALEEKKAAMTVEERLLEERKLTKGYSRKSHYTDFRHVKRLLDRLSSEGKKFVVISEEWHRGADIFRVEYSVYWEEREV